MRLKVRLLLRGRINFQSRSKRKSYEDLKKCVEKEGKMIKKSSHGTNKHSYSQ